MITHFLDTEDEITKETVAHKFGGDPMAEYLWCLMMVNGQDEDAGSVDWRYWCGRFGKRLLFTDDQGFVWVEKYNTEAESIRAFEAIANRYSEWADAEEGEGF